MAPLSGSRSISTNITGLSVSSLELDKRSTTFPPLTNISVRSDNISPKAVQANHRLVSRAATSYTPCAGCTHPENINNHAFFALFSILGVAMMAASIWFFFHAKNGGFKWQQGDWDDYKSTVLRRKGPDGKTLSNATKSTKLGGGSIVNHQERWAAKSVVGYDEKGRKGILGKRGFAGTHSVYYSDNFSDVSGSRADDMSEAMSQIGRDPRIRGGGGRSRPTASGGGHHAGRYRDRDVRAYKHEKAATVGGMNRAADSSQFGYSDRSETMTEISDRSTAPILTKAEKEAKKRTKAERRAHEEAARMERKWRREAEAAAAALARDQHESEAAAAAASRPKPKAKAPAAASSFKRDRRSGSRSNSPQKRDYSFSRGDDAASSVPSSSNRSASYYEAYRPRAERAGSRSPTKKHTRRYAESEAGSSDTGTKIYEHKIRGSPAKEKKGRDVMAGYRRGMDSLADSDEE